MSNMEERIEKEFNEWFAKLQALTDEVLDPDDWAERWFDGYTPQEALDDGPEDDDD